MAIKKDEVFRIADKMFSDGVAPTLIGLRAALGSGSFSTISALLTEWKASSRAALVADEDAPDELNDVFQAALRTMWSKAQEIAAETSATAAKDCQELIRLAVLKESDALELAQVVQADLDLVMARCMSLQCDLDGKNEQIAMLHQAIAEATATEKEFRRMHTEVVAAFKSKANGALLKTAVLVSKAKKS